MSALVEGSIERTGVAVANPYWDAVKDRVNVSTGYWPGPTVEAWPLNEPVRVLNRSDLTSRFAWSITDPDTVAFVAEHSRGRVIDPMAGTGYWAWLLGQHGVDVLAFDQQPPGHGVNDFHREGNTFATVQLGEAAQTVAQHGAGRTLLLSWPPYGSAVGHNTLAAYPGDRVIYIGEGESGCCGDDNMFALFASGWTEVAATRPVQWGGIHDFVTVYERVSA